jgi:hypothetical protein
MQKVVGSSPIVWTGREMLVFGGWNGNSEAADAATYDPRTNRWRRVPDWRPRWQNAAAWTGKRLIVWGGDGGDELRRRRGGVQLPHRTMDAASSEPAGTARQRVRSQNVNQFLRPSLRDRRGESIAWTGRSLIVWGGVRLIAHKPYAAAVKVTRQLSGALPGARER